MTIDMRQFYQVFYDETEELLAEMERLLLAIDQRAPAVEDLHAIFRAAHSIKGGAGTFGITDLTDITHVLETLLDLIRKGEMALTAQHVDAFLEAKDILKMQLDGHRLHTPVDQAAVAAVRLRLEGLSHQGTAGSASVLTPARASGAGIDARSAAASAPAVSAPAHAVSPPAARLRRFRIELPLVPQRDVDALAAEIGLLGTLQASAGAGGNAVFTLDTTDDAEAIIAICAFIMEPADLKISEQTADLSASQAADAMPSAEEQAAAAQRALEDAQGYGFFAPFAPKVPATEHAGDGSADDGGTGVDAPHAAPQASGGHAPAGHAGAADDHDGLAHAHDGTATAGEDKRSATRRDPDKAASGGESTSIRVSIEKVDQLINLVGELVITQAMIEQRTGALDPLQYERLMNSVSQLTRNTRDLQEAVMSIRMMPMDYVFSRFPRMVRDLAGKLGKKVEFVTIGAATELDKGLIERIVDPLTHLVRNSIDHGIEMPAQRLAAGKGETGRLALSASHQGGNIVIEVSDDGGGLSRERILAKAQERGIAVSETMADAEVWQLIFAPGFSTAEEVTDISGRGVGMDVVRRNIGAMGGAVDIRSAAGFGTTIAISLPLTLAILDGMSVRVGEEVYILPLGYVVESLQPAPIDVKNISGQGQVVKVRGDYLPLISLYRMFDIAPQHRDPSLGIVVILESEGRKAALFVDELVGQQQVVVKNLESNYRKVAGISGATILGDGGVSLIIDVAALLRGSQQLNSEAVLTS